MTALGLVRARGQVTVETAVLVAFFVAALVAMAAYYRRGYQGYLYSNASTLGSVASAPDRALTSTFTRLPPVQFDRAAGYSEDARLALTFQQSITSQEVDAPVPLAASDPPSTDGQPDLPSVPGGELSGRVLKTQAVATSTWDIRNRGNYNAP